MMIRLGALRRAISRLAGTAVRFLAARGMVSPWDAFVSAQMESLSPQSQRKPIRILALSPERFMGDLKLLAAQDGIEVFILKGNWQGKISALFAARSRQPYEENLISPAGEVPMKNFLRAFLRRHDIDVLLGTCVWYRQDIPWGSMAQKIGIPYVVLHRENLKTEPEQQRFVAETMHRFGDTNGFLGQTLITHNRPIRELVVDSGFAQPDQAIDGGCLRMDDFVRQARAYHKDTGGVPVPATAGRRKVTLFSFATGIGLNDLGVPPFPRKLFIGWYRLFELTHATFAAMARDHPDIDFVIKPKWEGDWIEWIRDAIRANGIEPDSLANLTITAKADAQELIFESDVVCGFGSTVLLEAGIVGKPVVVPHFEEALRPPYNERIKLRGSYDLFDVADTPGQFAELVQERLANPAVSAELVARREEAFREWVSNTEGTALQTYLEALRKAAEWGRRQRAADANANTADSTTVGHNT
jgi:hypothetical protein